MCSVLPYDPKAPSEPSTTGLVHVSFKTLTAQVAMDVRIDDTVITKVSSLLRLFSIPWLPRRPFVAPLKSMANWSTLPFVHTSTLTP